jgi:ribose transport system permease protein
VSPLIAGDTVHDANQSESGGKKDMVELETEIETKADGQTRGRFAGSGRGIIQLSIRGRSGEGARIVALLAAIALLMIVFEILSHGLEFKSVNIVDILDYGALLGIVTIGEAIVMISAGLDISVASTVGVVTAVVAVGMEHTNGNLLVGIGLGLATGAVAGVVNGVMVGYIGVNSVIATLATFSAFLGIALLATGGQVISVNNSFFYQLGVGKLGPIPYMVIVFVVVAIAGMVLMRYTVPGRRIYAVGSSQKTSRLSGIPVERYILGVYVLSGVTAAIAGIMLVAQTGAAQPNEGSSSLALIAITAVLLGGVPLAGGGGSVLGAALGVIVLSTLDNGLLLLGVPSFWQDVATGLLLIIAVTFQNYRVLKDKYWGRFGKKSLGSAPVKEFATGGQG